MNLPFLRPKNFSILSKSLFKGALFLAIVGFSLGYGWVWTLPEDAVQGIVFKILYIHVPAAWFSLAFYGALALCSLIYLVGKAPLAFFLAQSFAWVGATFAALCLVTGMIWGQPTWGTWWVWDARLTSMAVLLFLYLGYLTLIHAFPFHGQGAKSGSLLALFGSLNLPIIKWSVTWWNTLHQPASLAKWGAPSLDSTFLWPLLVCALGWLGYGTLCVLWLTWGFLKRQSNSHVKGTL